MSRSFPLDSISFPRKQQSRRQAAVGRGQDRGELVFRYGIDGGVVVDADVAAAALQGGAAHRQGQRLLGAVVVPVQGGNGGGGLIEAAQGHRRVRGLVVHAALQGQRPDGGDQAPDRVVVRHVGAAGVPGDGDLLTLPGGGRGAVAAVKILMGAPLKKCAISCGNL